MSWIASHSTWLLAVPLALLAAVHVLPLRLFRDGGYPSGYRAVTGALFALSAILMLVPEAKPIGTAVALLVMFLTAITLISRRQYGYAMPVVAMLFALVPVSLTL